MEITGGLGGTKALYLERRDSVRRQWSFQLPSEILLGYHSRNGCVSKKFQEDLQETIGFRPNYAVVLQNVRSQILGMKKWCCWQQKWADTRKEKHLIYWINMKWHSIVSSNRKHKTNRRKAWTFWAFRIIYNIPENLSISPRTLLNFKTIYRYIIKNILQGIYVWTHCWIGLFPHRSISNSWSIMPIVLSPWSKTHWYWYPWSDEQKQTQLWPFISYNWLFLWDYAFYKWGDLLVLRTGV